MPGHNLVFATLGVLLLWFGWFGFNAGSTTTADTSIALIAVNTNLAAAAGAVAAMVTAWLYLKKPDGTMALNGALAGLVAITAEPLTPSPLLATIVGAIGGLIVVAAIVYMDKAKIDDPVGAISVHGIVGIWGLLAVSFTNPEGSFVAQVIGAVVIFAWVFGTSFVTWLIIKAVMGIRVSEEEELTGCDISECGLDAYPEFTKD
jgi:Amt family ammonium transporter